MDEKELLDRLQSAMTTHIRYLAQHPEWKDRYEAAESEIARRVSAAPKLEALLGECRAAIVAALGEGDGQLGEGLFWLGSAYGQATMSMVRKEFREDALKIERQLTALLARLPAGPGAKEEHNG